MFLHRTNDKVQHFIRPMLFLNRTEEVQVVDRRDPHPGDQMTLPTPNSNQWEVLVHLLRREVAVSAQDVGDDLYARCAEITGRGTPDLRKKWAQALLLKLERKGMATELATTESAWEATDRAKSLASGACGPVLADGRIIKLQMEVNNSEVAAQYEQVENRHDTRVPSASPDR